jgi:flagellar hook-length control protein FliK
VHNGELRATIRADKQESAMLLREQMADLRASLEAEGVKVKELDVQTGLRQNLSADQWNGHKEHNLMHDAEERERLMRLARTRREAAEQAELAAENPQDPGTEQAGLYIVA